MINKTEIICINVEFDENFSKLYLKHIIHDEKQMIDINILTRLMDYYYHRVFPI
jgi:hypothetical protein